MAEQLGNGMERCLGCGGSGEIPESVHPILGNGPKRVCPAEVCPECGGSGEMPSGTDPLGAPRCVAPVPAVPESQEVLRQTLTDEIRRLEDLAEQECTSDG